MKMLGIFTPTKLNAAIDISHIVTLHYFKYTKDFAFSGEKHDFWEIVYVDQGEVGIMAESRGMDLHQGEAIFHKPNEYHNIWAKNQSANVVILSFVCRSRAMSFFENKIVHFDEQHRALLAKILTAGELCFDDPLNEVFQTKLNLSDRAPFGCQQTIKNYMELLLIALRRDTAISPRGLRVSDKAKLQGESNIIRSIQQMLAENIYNDITLDDILTKVCFSKSYMTRLFREQTGHSIMEYYAGLKIDEARKLISECNHSFTEIAEMLGYASIHYFSYTFKKKTGMTPSEYRKSVQSLAVL